jgi:hypothetical protein
VFHEKKGRRHAHCVWSRIRAADMKAVQLSFTHNRLMEVARELYIEHGWTMPRGLARSEVRDPRNFTLAEWQQAKRHDKDPRVIKTALQDAWAISDTRTTFALALEERGYRLARGDRRDFVAVDLHGEVYSLPRWIGVKTKEVRAWLGDEAGLPGVAEAKARIGEEMALVVSRLRSGVLDDLTRRNRDLRMQAGDLTARHRQSRQDLMDRLEARRWDEARERQARFRTGLKGIWDRVRGEHRRIRERNEAEAGAAAMRDRAELDALIFAQLEERRRMIDLRSAIAREFATRSRDLRQDLRAYDDFRRTDVDPALPRRRRRLDR